MRAILKWATQDTANPSAEPERFPDWFILMTRSGIDVDQAMEKKAFGKHLTPLLGLSSELQPQVP